MNNLPSQVQIGGKLFRPRWKSEHNGDSYATISSPFNDEFFKKNKRITVDSFIQRENYNMNLCYISDINDDGEICIRQDL